MTSLKKLLLGEQGLVVIFAVAYAIVALTVPNFLTERNKMGQLQSVVTIGIVGLFSGRPHKTASGGKRS